MNFWTALSRMHDDRNRQVVLVAPDAIADRDLKKRVQLRHSSNWGALAYMVVAITGGFLLVQVTLGWVGKRRMTWEQGILVVAVTLISGAVVAIWMRRDQLRRAADVRSALLRRGLCPQCAYALKQVTLAPDGCTVCPECGAAWRLPEEVRQSLRASSCKTMT